MYLNSIIIDSAYYFKIFLLKDIYEYSLTYICTLYEVLFLRL